MQRETTPQGTWTLLGKIAEGSGTELWLIEQDQKRCVLKIASPSTQRKEQVQKRLRHEAMILQLVRSRLSSTPTPSSLVSWLRSGGGEGGFFSIFQLIDGPNLATAMRLYGHPSKTLPPLVASSIVAAVQDALSLLHNIGIVHGDVVARNIVLSRTGEVRLVDFDAALSSTDVGIDKSAMQTLIQQLLPVQPLRFCASAVADFVVSLGVPSLQAPSESDHPNYSIPSHPLRG